VFVWSTQGPLAQRHGQFDAVQLLSATFATHGRAQSVIPPSEADTRRRVMARIESVSVMARMVDGRILEKDVSI
jgi:hypothetical protein